MDILGGRPKNVPEEEVSALFFEKLENTRKQVYIKQPGFSIDKKDVFSESFWRRATPFFCFKCY